ncbi:hypothetical protein G6O67_000578 [Ophiocordyceps sinensis]|uniref:Uncharacterized protein n=1 Tax=Ophiocordyceps sinensis TaxID=72228 RepID=A0A8H4V9X4_9HYPO|nr:hypothetical protein G6O67_000578 [Ophiocordyceps sinensis]
MRWGSGKTKEFFALVELHARLLEAEAAAGGAIEFLPTLVVNPVQTISQTAKESEQFPSLRVLAFYGGVGDYIGTDNVDIIPSRKLASTLLKLDPKDPKDPKNGLIMSSPQSPPDISLVFEDVADEFVNAALRSGPASPSA